MTGLAKYGKTIHDILRSLKLEKTPRRLLACLRPVVYKALKLTLPLFHYHPYLYYCCCIAHSQEGERNLDNSEMLEVMLAKMETFVSWRQHIKRLTISIKI